MPMPQRRHLTRSSNLWLAETLWKLGAVQFGSFTLGRTTVNSPVYVNLRLLIGHPTALWRAAQIIWDEIQALQSMLHPPVQPFELVAGVPFGGLHLATAFSLTAKVPMIYLHPRADGMGKEIEGIYRPNQERLRRQGINLVPLLSLETLMNYLMSSGKITEEWYRKATEFLHAHRHVEE